jgi:signal transduction histidine kinase
MQAKAFDVTLNVTVEAEVPRTVLLDADKVAWAVTAVVGNSLRYVRHGSEVMPGGMITVRVTYDATASAVTIEVQDDGRGIPAERLPLLFTPGRDRPRIGLGLILVRDIVVAHAGQIAVDAETTGDLRGTTIRLTLPV